jgi:hypothetical protein
VYQRIREVLTGTDPSGDFAHLSESDRQAIWEILSETKPDFRAAPTSGILQQNEQ